MWPGQREQEDNVEERGVEAKGPVWLGRAGTFILSTRGGHWRICSREVSGMVVYFGRITLLAEQAGSNLSFLLTRGGVYTVMASL